MADARKPIISGNWKMHHNHFEAIQCVQKLHYRLDSDDHEAVDVTVHPPFTDIRSVQTRDRGRPDEDRPRAPRTATGRRRARSPARWPRRCLPSSTSTT